MKTLTTCMLLVLAGLLLTPTPVPAEAGDTCRVLYTLTNDARDGKNAVIAYVRKNDGSLDPHPKGAFATRGKGIDNDTNGKLGPNDIDDPLIVSADRKRLFAVNGGSNTIAVFDVLADGALRHVAGSPFASMGVGPVGLALLGKTLVVANRNEDPHQLAALQGKAASNYASFHVASSGALRFVSRVELTEGQKATQILASQVDTNIAFGNDFQVDVDFDGEGSVSKGFTMKASVQGQLHSFRVAADGRLVETDRKSLPETAKPAPEVPTIPLGIWDHPTKRLLYVGFVTRNQLGVYRYDQKGKLTFVAAVPNSGQDICWLKTNKAGTRLYAVNNLPREDEKDTGSTVTVFDIAGAKAEKPVEIGRVVLPMPGGTFVNNRGSAQPNSTAFQFDLDPQEKFLYVLMQRINQTPANKSSAGNLLHTLAIGANGLLKVASSRSLEQDGVAPRARPQGVLSVDLP